MRTDIHSPKNLRPEDYEFLGCGNYQTAELDSYSPLMSEYGQKLLSEGWKFADVETDGCQHCGRFIIYYAILLHPETKTFLRVGEQCLDNRFSMANDEFQRLRKQRKLNKDRMALKDKREAWLNSNPDNREAYDWANERVNDGDFGWEGFRYNFVHLINRYGDTSDKFVAAILKDKNRAAEREARKAEEAANASPVVEGKITVKGQVLSMKWQENAYGGSLKMLVKDERGFKVWGTCPRTIVDEIEKIWRERNDAGESYETYKHLIGKVPITVEFSANVTKSDDDETFGFYNRPTKGVVVR